MSATPHATIAPEGEMDALRVAHATGDAASRGQQIGRELRDLINESIDSYHRYLSRRGVSSTPIPMRARKRPP